eukprot:7007415-Alexandrium_andersonii.AAC.1
MDGAYVHSALCSECAWPQNPARSQLAVGPNGHLRGHLRRSESAKVGDPDFRGPDATRAPGSAAGG